MKKLKSLPKSLIMLTLLMGSFLTAKSAQTLEVREASVNNPLPRNVFNYNGSPACFISLSYYAGCPRNMSCPQVQTEEIVVGKVHSAFCHYVNDGRVERASNYKVVTYQDYEYGQIVWVRDRSDVHQSRIGNRRWKPFKLGDRARGEGICGLNYRNEYHIGEVRQIADQYICLIPYGENAVQFPFGQFYIAGYLE
jgi:hypothetical protein